MRLLFMISITLAACSEGGSAQPDLATGGGGFICPSHPENCDGTCCGNKCLNTNIDVNNCGACNAACTGGTVCMGGHCGCLPSGAPCSMSQTCCPNAGCADLQTDIRNCGACGKSCGNGATCVAGQCKCGNTVCSGTDVCCNGMCQATCNVSMPDMAMPMGMPLCDCSALFDPFGSNNQCPVTSQCVGNNCCLENQIACDTIGCSPGTCEDPTPCQASVTPQ